MRRFFFTLCEYYSSHILKKLRHNCDEANGKAFNCQFFGKLSLICPILHPSTKDKTRVVVMTQSRTSLHLIYIFRFKGNYGSLQSSNFIREPHCNNQIFNTYELPEDLTHAVGQSISYRSHSGKNIKKVDALLGTPTYT